MGILLKLREHNKLPDAESEVRDYILKNGNDVLKMSVQELAEKSFTSPATVIRLCQRLELKGFSELKIELASEFKAYEQMNINVLDNSTIKKNDTYDEIINKVTDASLKSIEETYINIDKTVLIEVAKKVMACTTLDLYGIGASNVIAFDAGYKFMRIGKNIACLSLADRQRIQAINSDKSHFAMLISYSGETKEILEIASILQEQGVPSVSVTSSAKNRLMDYCDYNLFVSSRESNLRNGAIVSRTSTLYILDVLYMICISLDYENSMNSIRKTVTVSK